MLKVLIELQAAVKATCLAGSSLRQWELREQHWTLIQRLCGILGHFVDGTVKLFASSYPTLSDQLPYYIVISQRLEAQVISLQESDPNSELLHAVNAAWHKVNEYYCLTSSAQTTATIMDSRYKLQTFQHLKLENAWIEQAKADAYCLFEQRYRPGVDPQDASTSSENEFVDNLTQAVFGSQPGSTAAHVLETEFELDLGKA